MKRGAAVLMIVALILINTNEQVHNDCASRHYRYACDRTTLPFVSAEIFVTQSPPNSGLQPGASMLSTQFPFGVTTFNITGLLVRPTDDVTGCTGVHWVDKLYYMNQTYAYILVIKRVFCSMETSIRAAQRVGAIAVVDVSSTINSPASLGLWTWTGFDGSETSSFEIPYVQTTKDEAELLVLQSVPVTSLSSDRIPADQSVTIVTLTNSHNQYQTVFQSVLFFVAFRVVLTGFSVLIIVLAIVAIRGLRRISRHSRHSKPKIALTCLGIEAFANCIRAVYFAIDPAFTGHNFPYPVERILTTVTFPMAFCTSVLIALFWVETTKAVSASSINWLTRLKVPFFVCTAIMFLADWAAAIVQGPLYGPPGLLTTLSGAVLAFSSFAVGLLFLFSGRKLTRALRSFDVHSRAVRRLTRWIMGSGACMILNTMTLVFSATPLFLTPIGYAVDFWLLFFTVNATSFAQTYVFFLHSRVRPGDKRFTLTPGSNKININTRVQTKY